jgi:hypothetical protein
MNLGKRITELSLGDDDKLYFEFEHFYKMKIFDAGQECCEARYMRTDDNLKDYIGSTLLGIEIKKALSIEDDDGEHEIQFLEFKTSKGCFTMASHNEHNGYYGGFDIRVEYL